jgi:hypothetical protein
LAPLTILAKAEAKDLVFTWSENPYSDMWNQLMFLSKKNNAKKLLSGEIKSGRQLVYEKGEELERKSSQVSFGISQASEYYKAAESASVTTSPLLYFYGMLSLAKTLITANKKDIYFEDIKYHGLTQKHPKDAKISEYRKDPEKWELECEFAVTRNGVSTYLTDIYCGFQFPNWCVITFKDIISICPEISEMYELYYGEPSRTVYLYNFKEISKDPYKIEICPKEQMRRTSCHESPSWVKTSN